MSRSYQNPLRRTIPPLAGSRSTSVHGENRCKKLPIVSIFMTVAGNHARSLRRWLAPALSLVMLALLAGGAWLFMVQRGRLQAAAEANLNSIARLKVDQLVQWRYERLGDASVLMENPYSAGAL